MIDVLADGIAHLGKQRQISRTLWHSLKGNSLRRWISGYTLSGKGFVNGNSAITIIEEDYNYVIMGSVHYGLRKTSEATTRADRQRYRITSKRESFSGTLYDKEASDND